MNKNLIKELIKRNDPVFLEIGAGDGTDSREFIKLFNETNFEYFLFEPDQRNISTIINTIHDGRVVLYEGIVGDRTGIVDFYQSTKSPSTGEELIFSSSMREPTEVLYRTWPQFVGGFAKTTVKSTKLDDFVESMGIERADFVWLDCQGCEDMVIYGGRNTFDNKVKYLYTEYSDRKIYKDEPTLNNIMSMLPNYKIIETYPAPKSNGLDGDVLLRNMKVE